METNGARTLFSIARSCSNPTVLRAIGATPDGKMMTRLTREETQQRTRTQILDTAERLFLSEGYHGISVDMIAAAAGYSRGAVYSNWPGKEALAVAILDRYYDALTVPLNLNTPTGRMWIDFELQVVGVNRDTNRFERLAAREPVALSVVMQALAVASVTGGRIDR